MEHSCRKLPNDTRLFTNIPPISHRKSSTCSLRCSPKRDEVLQGFTHTHTHSQVLTLGFQQKRCRQLVREAVSFFRWVLGRGQSLTSVCTLLRPLPVTQPVAMETHLNPLPSGSHRCLHQEHQKQKRGFHSCFRGWCCVFVCVCPATLQGIYIFGRERQKSHKIWQFLWWFLWWISQNLSEMCPGQKYLAKKKIFSFSKDNLVYFHPKFSLLKCT